MPGHQTTLSFNGGELSPYLLHRTDFEKNLSGLELCENFLPLPYGGLRKRPGLNYLADLTVERNLIPFLYDTDNRYILGFSTTDLKVFGTDGTLKDTVTFAFGDPFQIQLAHVNDVAFLVSPNFEPQRLTRTADTTWTLEDLPFTHPPVLDANVDRDYTLTVAPTSTPSAWSGSSVSYTAGDIVSNGGSNWTCISDHTSSASDEPGSGIDGPEYWRRSSYAAGESVKITASASTFASTDVGKYFKISYERAVDEWRVVLTAVSANDGKYSDAIAVQTSYNYATYGSIDGTFTVEESLDEGITWTAVREDTFDKDRNVNEDIDIDTRRLVRLAYAHTALGSTAPRAILEANDSMIDGYVRITAYTSATVITAEVIQTVEDCTTYHWNEGAFSESNGFPVAITLHDQRVILAGTTTKPVSLWSSATDDLLNFEQGTAADSGFYRTLASTSQDPIRWMASQRRLFVGTAAAEWVIGSDTSDASLSPENFVAREYTHYGSAAIPAFRYHDGVFFIERQARRLRELGFDITRETYQAADLSRLAEHITQGGIVDIDFQYSREPTLWTIRGDGTLLSFVYNREERIAAWTRHTSYLALFKSVCVLRSDSTDDSVYVCTQRGIYYYLEQFATGQQATQEAGTTTDAHHLDFASTGTTDGSGDFAVGSRFNGATVTYLADGIPGTALCTAGTISTGKASVTIVAGWPITSTATTLPLEAPTQTGMSHGRRKRASRINASLFYSRGGTWTYSGNEPNPIEYDTTADPGDQTPELRSGWFETQLSPGFVNDLQFTLTHADPWPFTLRALAVFWETSEP